MNLSKNFNLRELTESTTAARLGIDNYPTADHIHNLAALVENVLQPLRDAIGYPIRITSGYRSPELNKAIGGAEKNGVPTSEHCRGSAADIKLIIDGENCSERLYLKVLELGLEFRQMIWEFGDDDTPQWVHISYFKGDNKKQKLRAYKENGKTKYSEI